MLRRYCIALSQREERCPQLAADGSTAEYAFCSRHQVEYDRLSKRLAAKEARLNSLSSSNTTLKEHDVLVQELQARTKILQLLHPNFFKAKDLELIRLRLQREEECRSSLIHSPHTSQALEIRACLDSLISFSVDNARRRDLELAVIKRYLATDTERKESFLLTLLFCMAQHDLLPKHWDAAPPVGVSLIKEFLTLEDLGAEMTWSSLMQLRQYFLKSRSHLEQAKKLFEMKDKLYCVVDLSSRSFLVGLSKEEYSDLLKGSLSKEGLVRAHSLLTKHEYPI